MPRIGRRGKAGILVAAVVAAMVGGALLAAPRLRARMARVELPRPQDAEQALWIGHVAVFDGETLLPPQDVLVRGAQIASVTPAGAQPPPDAALKLDGSGRTLLPGLVDAHVHLLTAGSAPWKTYIPDVPANAQAMLYAGVTSGLVAASGADEDELVAQAASGRVPAPHLYLAGPGLTAPGGHPIPFIHALIPWPLSSLITMGQPVAATPDEARSQVAKVRERHHPPLFKIFYDDIPVGSPHMSREVLAATVAAVREQGMRSVVHIGSSADMVAAAEAGAALLMHPPSKDVLTDDQVARLRTLGTPFVTTLRTVMAAEQVGRGGGTRLERESVESRVLADFSAPPSGWVIKGFEGMEKEFPLAATRLRDNVRRLIQAGVPFLVGTDTGVFGVFPGAGMHGEMLELASSGVPALAVLRAATSAPAAFLDPNHTFGRVAAGQRADLLLVRGDPVANLAAVSEIDEVFLAGRRLTRHAASN